MIKQVSLLTIWLILFAAQLINAQPGSLDLSFGNSGKVVTPIGTYNDEGRAIAIQSDGKILVAGFSFNGSNYDFALLRYKTNGNLDSTFATNGISNNAFGPNRSYANGIAIQNDGKIVVTGSSKTSTNDDFGIVRYNSNGFVDSSFGTNGKVSTPISISSDDNANSIAIQTDGKIIVVGSALIGSTRNFILVRYNINGTLDNTFGTNGITNTDFGNSDDDAWSVALQPDGKILVSGNARYSSTKQLFAIARYNSNGSLDNSFANTGKDTVFVNNINSNWGYSMALQLNGKILVGGYSNGGTSWVFSMVRFNNNGQLDANFGAGGKVMVSNPSFSQQGRSIALQSNGKILLGGLRNNGSADFFSLCRFDSTGTLDAGFGASGTVTTSIGGIIDDGYSVSIQSDGKILLAGATTSNNQKDIAIVRYNGDFVQGIVQMTSSSNQILVYPNPNDGLFQLKIDNEIENGEIILINSLGQKVYEHRIFQDINNINASNLNKGQYDYLILQDGKLICHGKLSIK